MAIRVELRSITLSGGEVLAVPEHGVVVLVGALNVDGEKGFREWR
jgi:hypothetical protein